MVERQEAPTTVDSDVEFCEAFKFIGTENGFYVECGAMTMDGETTYYAMIMPRDEYDALLASINERDRKAHDSIALMPFERWQPFKPYEVLHWNDFIEQKSMVSDHPTRRAALYASIKKQFYS